MSMQNIRDTYQVPAKRGMRVSYKFQGDGWMYGKIVGSRGMYIRIRADDSDVIRTYHPTYNMLYEVEA